MERKQDITLMLVPELDPDQQELYKTKNNMHSYFYTENKTALFVSQDSCEPGRFRETCSASF